jgi:hypothetical protein
MIGPRRSSSSLAVFGGLAVIASLLGAPQPVAAVASDTQSVRLASADAVTVTVAANAVDFLPTGIEIYSQDLSLNIWCMGTVSCSLDVPVGTPMVVKFVGPVQFSLACPAGSNTDGPGLIDGLWNGWCGTSSQSPIVANADVTVTATATLNVLPTAFIEPLPTWTMSTAIELVWGGTAGNWPIASYDVRYRRAAWNGAFGTWTTWKSATTDEDGVFAASTGATYCFSVRANDTNGGHSAWADETCTAVPLDDRSVSRVGSWSAGTGASYYRSTYLRSSTTGARLTRSGVVAKRIALVATTCSTCGTVKVYWGSTLLKTISLHSRTTVNQKLITVATFSSARTGTLRITVSSSGKRVIVDGVAIRRN